MSEIQEEEKELTISNISRRAFVAGVTMLSLNLIGCSNNAPTQKKAPTNVNVVCKVYQKGLKEDCSFLILHLVGCCAKTKGIDKVFSFTYDDIVNNNVCFSTTAGKYHLYIIPPTTEGMIYTTKLERSVVLTGETKEEHIKNKAEAEGITEEEAKTLLHELQDELGEGPAAVIMPLRAVITGKARGADLYTVIAVIGKERTLKRIHNIIK